jgi:hypothetical protein
MNILASPTTWAGAASCFALAGWIVGRWHALAMRPSQAPDQPSVHHAPAAVPAGSAGTASSLLFASNASADWIDNAMSLSELHDEITALRRRERVLATILPDASMLDRSSADLRQCRKLASIADSACDCLHDSQRPGDAAPQTQAALWTQRAAQPSPGRPSLTRV